MTILIFFCPQCPLVQVGDIVVIGDECGRITKLGQGSKVVIQKRRNQNDPPFLFVSEPVEVDVQSAKSLFHNQIHLDQYKVLFGHKTITWGASPLFVRMKHTSFGDYIFGQKVGAPGSKTYIFVGVVEAPGKRKSWNFLLTDGLGAYLTLPLSKQVVPEIDDHEKPVIADSTTLKTMQDYLARSDTPSAREPIQKLRRERKPSSPMLRVRARSKPVSRKVNQKVAESQRSRPVSEIGEDY